MEIELREAVTEDFNFAFEAKKQAMGPHIISKWGWDEDYQLSVHTQRWQEKPWFIILLNDESIGTLSIHQFKNYIRFGEFYLLDEFRNKGIGTEILQTILADSDRKFKRVVLEYLKWNRVDSLYRRNGFKLIGENETHYFMERRAKSR